MSGNASEKVALVTGAGLGIGRATAIAFAAQGTKVVVADLSEEDGRDTVAQIGDEGGEALFVHTDVSDSNSVQSLVATTVSTYGRLDFAHNNAGVATRQLIDTANYPEDEWDRMIAVNLTGVWLCMKHQVPVMRKQGNGVIVNTSSLAGLSAMPNASAYTASKFGVIGITKAAALEYAEAGIRVNAICPGYVLTPMVEEVMERNKEVRAEETLLDCIPIGRMGEPAEIAAAVMWLCSEEAAFITGHALPVDGGMHANWAGS